MSYLPKPPADSFAFSGKNRHWHLHATQPAPWYKHHGCLMRSSSLKKSMAPIFSFTQWKPAWVFLQPGQHLLMVPHPHQSVDCDTFFTSSERRIEEIDKILPETPPPPVFLTEVFPSDRFIAPFFFAASKNNKGGFETESDAWISTNHINGMRPICSTI